MAIRHLALAVVCGSLLAMSSTSQSKPPSLNRVCEARAGAEKTSGSAPEHALLAELVTSVKRRTHALKERDAPELKRLLSPDFVYTNASGRVFDREGYIGTYALDPTVEWESQTLSDVCVLSAGEIAILTAVTHDVARFGQFSLNARFRTTQAYRRSGKGWAYIAGHTSNIE